MDIAHCGRNNLSSLDPRQNITGEDCPRLERFGVSKHQHLDMASGSLQSCALKLVIEIY